jgi:hypothetical protein
LRWTPLTRLQKMSPAARLGETSETECRLHFSDVSFSANVRLRQNRTFRLRQISALQELVRTITVVALRSSKRSKYAI